MRDCQCYRTNRSRRGVLRTDVGAGRCEWSRGRAHAVAKVGVGLPDIFRWFIGQTVTAGGYVSEMIPEPGPVFAAHAICVHYDTGLLVLA